MTASTIPELRVSPAGVLVKRDLRREPGWSDPHWRVIDVPAGDRSHYLGQLLPDQAVAGWEVWRPRSRRAVQVRPRLAGAGYLDGPHPARLELFRDCYANDPSIEGVEAAAEMAAAIDHWLCGPYDDCDEGQEYILTRAVERAARFIAERPCTCEMPEGDLCARCWAIGCGWGEHRMACGGGSDG